MSQQALAFAGEVEVVVDRDLKIHIADLPEDILKEICAELTFPNPAKEAAEREELWGWEDMPDTIVMWKLESPILSIPRGFASRLHTGLQYNGFEVKWADIRADRSMHRAPDMRPIWFTADRDYQEEAVESILRMEQGMWKAPPGAGKTVGVLEAIRRSGQKAIVIVDKTNIARQWVQRSEQFLEYTPGLVGDGEHDTQKQITIAMQQTLWSQREMLEGVGFFANFGFVCLDECHHLPATTFLDTVQRFKARYRIGVSGTPDLQGMLPIMEAAVGPVFHTTEKQVLRDRGILVQPTVDIVETGFKASFWPTHRLVRYFTCVNGHRKKKTNDGLCVECGAKIESHEDTCPWRQAGCTGKGKVHRNNYHKVIDALVKDDHRNELVAWKAMKRWDEGGSVVVLSSRLEHLRVIRDHSMRSGVPEEDAIMFTGEQTGEERMEIAERADQGGCILFSTIADEALDIPRLDTLVLAYPGRNVEKTKQRIGRIERNHPLKLDPLVIDFSDDANVFQGQLQDRRQLYASEGLSVRFVADSQG